MNADISGNAMPGNVSIIEIYRSLSQNLHTLKIKLQVRDSNKKFFIHKAKCLNLTFDYHILQIVSIIPASSILEIDPGGLCYTKIA